MATITLHPGERRQAFWVVEDTTESTPLQVSINGGTPIPLTWAGEENWSLWLQAAPAAFPATTTVSPGLSGVTISLVSTGEIMLFDAGAINVLTGCDWPVDWSACVGAPPDEELRERAEALAVATLRSLTLNRVGGCPITVRPCAQNCTNTPSSWWWAGFGSTFYPHVNARGRWVNSCGCSTRCHCGPALAEITLDMPVGRVDEVWVHGEMLDPSAYRIDDGFRLVRLDGADWPACQDMVQPHDGPDAFAITYLNAYPVTMMGAIAAGVLAGEFAKACTTGKCALPAGVTQIARQGSTLVIAQDLFAGGLTGIREVDVFTAQYNPNRLRVRPGVYSPDLVGYRRVSQ